MGNGDDSGAVRALHAVMLRAFIYLRELANGAACIEYCQVKGYRVLGIVYDPEGVKYDGVFDAVTRGDGEVIVVWDFGDLPANRVPRVEPVNIARPTRHVALADPVRPSATPRRRRPRPIA